MRQRTRVTALAAVLDVVVDRVVVGRDGLKRGEIGFGDGAARDMEAVADRETYCIFLKSWLTFRPLAAEPRFRSLLAQVGLDS